MTTAQATLTNQNWNVLDLGIADDKVQTGFGSVADQLKGMFKSARSHYLVPVTRITDEQKFSFLALTWQRDTNTTSSITDMVSHPAYQQIIGMGMGALPFIFAELQASPQHWFWALQSITGINPIQEENKGNVGAMTQDWLNWGIKHGYVRG